MDPRINPYSPGAGTPPPELAGRDVLREKASIALDRRRNGLASKSLMLIGLRGVGKTVLLNQIRKDAEASGFVCLMLEAPEQKSLPAMLAPPLRAALLRLDPSVNAGAKVKRALRALGNLIGAARFKYEDIEFRYQHDPEPGLADSGDLEADLIDLFQAIGEAAKDRKTAFALFIDELQYVAEDQLAALITALHRMSQEQLPVILIGAGLPQLVAQTGRAKSYAERLFEFPVVGPLARDEAAVALEIPARTLGVRYEPEAIEQILRDTEAYPYFLQEWGKHCWDVADHSPIERGDVEIAKRLAVAELDVSFFRVRLDRLAPAEKKYLRAMAELGPGPHRSGDIARVYGVKVESVAPVRAALIAKGMVYSPSHGDTAFTVPLFDEFMKRAMTS